MFLTKITLNPERTVARRLVSDNQSIHAAVMKSFSQDALDAMSEESGRVLYRLETNRRDPLIYIMSPVAPDTAHIVEQAGRVADVNGSVTKSYDGVLNQISVGQRYKFSVRVNPVKRNGSKSTSLSNPEAIKEWFEKKAESLGIGVDQRSIEVVQDGIFSFKGSSQNISLRWADIEGELEVRDSEQFRSAIINGVGRGKGYGLGLLTIARL